MLAYIGRRIVIAVAMVVTIAALAFVLMQLMPNDVTSTILGETATPEQRAELREELGLNRPFLVQFGEYMAGLLTGDLGDSIVNGRSVTAQVFERLPVTLTLALLGIILCLVVGIVLGAVAAVRGGWLDGIIRSASSLLLAVPSVWLGVLLVYVFAVSLRVLPSSGWTTFERDPMDWALHLVLPLTAVVAGGSASIARQTRVAMLDNLARDYVVTLRAAGLPAWRVNAVHALRNASIPVLTVVGLQFVSLLGGVIVIEQVFGLPGLGSLTVSAATTGDFTMLIGIVVYTSALVLVMNILIDILYAAINPKARIA